MAYKKGHHTFIQSNQQNTTHDKRKMNKVCSFIYSLFDYLIIQNIPDTPPPLQTSVMAKRTKFTDHL